MPTAISARTSPAVNGRKAGTMTKRKDTRADAAPAIGDRLLALREAGDVLRLSTRTMREYVQSGGIEGRIIGGRWRFRRADLDAFFANALRNWDCAGKDGDGH